MKKLILASATVVILAGAGFWYYGNNGKAEVSPYRFVTLDHGSLESVVTSTGTLRPVRTVQVGTQVSGRIDRLLVDFNDNVRRGQLLAMIDTTFLVSAIRDSETGVQRARAQLAQAEREFTRLQALHEKQIVTEVEFNRAAYDLETARASHSSALISLDRAQQNLTYASIRAPMNGTVVERNVDVGQTVAASLSAPQLFLIANDLSQMQIIASVDESDIGRIREGQDVRFYVQSYPDELFTGAVRQIRLQSRVEQSVVSYSVVVDVKNEKGLLLPGMTATVEFLIERVDDVFRVPNAALRFRPTPDMLASLRERAAQRTDQTPDSLRRQRGDGASGDGRAHAGRGGWSEGGAAVGGAMGAGAEGAGRPGRADMVMLWTLDEDGNLSVRRVRTGITDGQFTEVRGDGLEVGLQVISGVTESGRTAASSPFQQQGTDFRMRSF
jgi:HlyD family secretion protein